MSFSEWPVVFDCEGERLVGVITKPHEQTCKTGVLIVVGGPQYRAGSHRQFTLLARELAKFGVASLRFDYRGMGDSEGDKRSFTEINEDIRCAISEFFLQVPTLSAVTLWGLCDAASAALLYAKQDVRVSNLVLLNPWVHTEELASYTRLKHYYLTRFLSISFWRKLFSGGVRIHSSFQEFSSSLRRTFFPKSKSLLFDSSARSGNRSQVASNVGHANFVEKMQVNLQQFRGNVLFILSGNDLVAAEFLTLKQKNLAWRKVLRRDNVDWHYVPDANHTFSSVAWRNEVALVTYEAVRKISFFNN